MAIEFRCPECQKLLRTADDKAGASAKCPQCGVPVRVPSASEAPVATAPPPAAPFGDLAGVESPAAAASAGAAAADEFSSGSAPPLPGGDERPCPMCGERIRAAATRCRFCGETFAGAASGNPAVVGVPRKIEIGDIISRSWTIFQKEMGMCLGVFWIPMMILFGLYLGGYFGSVIAVVSAIGPGRNPDPSIFILIFGVAFLFFLAIIGAAAWLMPGMHMAMLKIARGERAEIADVFRGGRFALRMFGNTLLVSLIMILEYVVIALVTIVPFAFLAGNQNPEYIIIGLVLFYPTLLVALMTTQTMIWPFQWVLVDRDPPGIGCLTEAMALTKGQRVMSFAKLMVESIIAGAGQIALCVGVIFTAPFAVLMSAVSYCDITGQPTANR